MGNVRVAIAWVLTLSLPIAAFDSGIWKQGYIPDAPKKQGRAGSRQCEGGSFAAQRIPAPSLWRRVSLLRQRGGKLDPIPASDQHSSDQYLEYFTSLSFDLANFEKRLFDQGGRPQDARTLAVVQKQLETCHQAMVACFERYS